jgi:hypothetical protein
MTMNPEVFNMEVRQFLKKVGVSSQREIENAVQAALNQGQLQGNEKLRVVTTVKIEALGLTHVIEGGINLE